MHALPNADVNAKKSSELANERKKRNAFVSEVALVNPESTCTYETILRFGNINGLVAEHIVAIVVTRLRFLLDAEWTWGGS